MILFPPAKLNLGLQIISRRSDGFHNLQTVFHQIALTDILEIVEDVSIASGECVIQSTGIHIPEGENLCQKAYRLLHAEFQLPGVQIHLHKIIPMGAGLGGGSSDATYTLKGLSKLFKLNLSVSELRAFAHQLGSDCPLFVENTSQYAEGRGELLSNIEVNLAAKNILLINPQIHISTDQAYAKVNPKNAEQSCRDIVLRDVSFWKEELKNDFEEAIFPMYPDLKMIKDRLYDLGADYAAMSGSGSTMFAIFSGEIPEMNWPENYFIWKGAV